MNKYVKFGIGAVIFVLVILGANVLYGDLADKYGEGNKIVTLKDDAASQNDESTQKDKNQDDEVLKSTGDTQESTEDQKQENVEEQNTDSKDTETQEETQENIKAMDFKMLNSDGEETTLYSFVGKPIVINFWASWCGPCKSELPDFQAAYEEYGEDVEFLMVNMTDGMRETIDVANEYIVSSNYSFPVYFDTTQEAAYAYSVYSIPMTFFIDAEGNIAAYAKGMINSNVLKEGIGLIFQKN